MRAFERSTYFVLSFAATAMILACTANTAEEDTTSTLLTITSLVGSEGDEVLSDVCDTGDDGDPFITGCSVANDVAQVTIRALPKSLVSNVGVTPQYNDVLIDRYRVTYRRSDGRNTPGVDVPYPIDGVMNMFIEVEGSGSASFTIVRDQAKLEPPLINLKGGGGATLISTLTRVDFYGRDGAGRAISATGYINITFADYAEQ